MSEVLSQLEPQGILKPDGNKHAIIEVIVDVSFLDALPAVETWKERLEGSSSLLNDFERADDLHGYGFSYQAKEDKTLTASDALAQLIGFRLEKNGKEPGRPDWVLLGQNSATATELASVFRIHCLNYVSFEDFLSQTQKWLSELALAWADLRAFSLSLTYVDRFRYPEKRIDALADILNSDFLPCWNRLVGESAFGDATFRSYAESGTEQYQLSYHPDSNENACILQMYHVWQKKAQSHSPLSAWLALKEYDSVLKDGRLQNRKRLQEIFSPAVLNKIGLDDPDILPQ